MRFATRFDRPLIAGLAACAIMAVGLPARAWLLHRVPVFVPLGVCAIFAYVLLSTLPQYYEVREDGLFLRLGMARRVLLPPSTARTSSRRRIRTAF